MVKAEVEAEVAEEGITNVITRTSMRVGNALRAVRKGNHLKK